MAPINDTNLEDVLGTNQDDYELIDEHSEPDNQPTDEDIIARGEKRINSIAKQIFRVLVVISGLLVIALSIPGILETSTALFIIAGDVIILAVLGILEGLENSKGE